MQSAGGSRQPRVQAHHPVRHRPDFARNSVENGISSSLIFRTASCLILQI